MGERVDAIDPVDVVRELSQRFQAGDQEGAFALFHPGIRIVQPGSLPHGGAHEGHAGVVDMGTRFAELWDRTIADPRIVGGDDGETVTQVTTQTWTAKATGRTATVDVVELLTVTGGLVTEILVFPQDTHLLLSTLP